MTALVALSYGRDSEYRRAIMAILSFWGWTSNQQVEVLLFTDNPAYFEPYLAGLPVKYVLLTPEKLRAMRGELDFVHRVKIAVIEEAFALSQPEKLLYIDSDTYFQADPAPLLAQLSDEVSAMHEQERTFAEFAVSTALDNREARQFAQLLEQKALTTTREGEHFHTGLSSWNAGTLGLGAAAAAMLPDVYELTTQIYQATGWHTSEQNAFGLLLQTRTRLIATSPYIRHYWTSYDKQAMDSILAEKLPGTSVELPLAERLEFFRQWTTNLPAAMQAYFDSNVTLQLQMQAVQAFINRQLGVAYRQSFAAILRTPGDRRFIRDVLYHTKRLLLG